MGAIWLWGPAAGPTGRETRVPIDLEAGARCLELEGLAEGLLGDVEDRSLGSILARDAAEELAQARSLHDLAHAYPQVRKRP